MNECMNAYKSQTDASVNSLRLEMNQNKEEVKNRVGELTFEIRFLYFVVRASRYNYLLIINLTHFFISLFITPLYMFQASQCSSSGDKIVLMHHPV